MRKQLDPRIQILINNNVKKNHRSFIVLVGDKSRDQVWALFLAQCATYSLTLRIDCQFALLTLSSSRICTAFGFMVLQKRSRVYDVCTSSVNSPLMTLSVQSNSHRKKREAKIKREVKRGIREPNEQNPFEIFVTVTDLRYT